MESKVKNLKAKSQKGRAEAKKVLQKPTKTKNRSATKKPKITPVFVKFDEPDEVCKNIKLLRINNNLSQKNVAQAIGVSQQTYSNYEKNGKCINCDALINLCEYFGVSADNLLGINGEKTLAKR